MKFLSQVYTIARGSVGGITYTANQFAALIARAKTSPVNPNTPRQTIIRSAFSGANQLWKDATQVVRDGWDDYASTLIFSGPLGSYALPGRQVFIANISLALFLQATEGVPVAVATDPPVIPGFLDLEGVGSVAFVPVGTGVSISGTFTGSENAVLSAWRSVAFNLTRTRFKGPFKTLTLDTVSIVAPGSGLIDFSGLTIGLRYFMKIRGITAQAPFRSSAVFYDSAIAVTNV